MSFVELQAGVPKTVLDELAQTLLDKIDILLDRLTDRALAAPQAGSQAWRAQWADRGSRDGQQLQAQRMYIRAELSSRANIGLTQAPVPAALPHAAGVVARPRSPKRNRVAPEQLAMF
ncbi:MULTISPECIES: hypothetical protein [unclassified Rhodococcus (in: high G+C Gram-positive bacteria)]|uniref:hypothetical protein n=1 Tax=unclassified Rhodococcus (in: high G+C Gram-positive bacteria) TaxID=192944 RepID=UPI0033923BBD